MDVWQNSLLALVVMATVMAVMVWNDGLLALGSLTLNEEGEYWIGWGAVHLYFFLLHDSGWGDVHWDSFHPQDSSPLSEVSRGVWHVVCFRWW